MLNKTIQEKWNLRYSTTKSSLPEPVWVLQEYDYLLPDNGAALDLACGLGGNALFLAQKGLTVSGWDISDVAVRTLRNLCLSKNLVIDAQVRDLETEPPEPASWDVLVVSYYLHLPLFRHLVAALKPGGLVYYQTYTSDRLSGGAGPSNPDFLLQRNELLHAFSSLEVLIFRDEGLVGETRKGLRGQSAIVARKPL
jgi:SAM-dependent methyltransferase